jgi:uncharacterized protein YbdZ (MbtH family)
MSRNTSDGEDNTIYKVVMNHEEQYSIWPDYKELPNGWRYGGKTGLKSECLAHIKEVWTDMRPLSLRKKMEEFSKNPPPQQPASPNQVTLNASSLVDRLCDGNHPVEAGLRRDRTAKRLKEDIDRGHVFVRFTQTRGGTELGFDISRQNSDFADADFDNQKGRVHIEGELTLDYTKVRCIADIDLSTLEGQGHLVKV